MLARSDASQALIIILKLYQGAGHGTTQRECTVGTLTVTRSTALLLLAFAASGCAGTDLEAHTIAAVSIYSQPNRPHVAGNEVIGTIPPNVTLRVRREKIMKGYAAYEVEYKETNGHALKGYVLLGTDGLVIRRP
jgi:hypothetical protein